MPSSRVGAKRGPERERVERCVKAFIRIWDKCVVFDAGMLSAGVRASTRRSDGQLARVASWKTCERPASEERLYRRGLERGRTAVSTMVRVVGAAVGRPAARGGLVVVGRAWQRRVEGPLAGGGAEAVTWRRAGRRGLTWGGARRTRTKQQKAQRAKASQRANKARGPCNTA